MNESGRKYALITGASRGIGRAIAIQLAQDGYNILINYKSNDEAARRLLDEITTADSDHQLLKFDVTNQSLVNECIGQWVEGNPDAEIGVLVNNSGIRKDNLLVFMSDDDWRDVIDTNLNAFYYVTKVVCSMMVKKRRGRIVNIVSLSGLKGMPGQVNYSASKAGVIAATKSLAQELAKRSITVNAVAPGFIQTDMTEDLNVKELSQIIPMNRFGNPEEVADLVSFLVSGEASYITGQVISINGGLY